MWACFIVFSPQEGMMHIICSSTAFVWAPEETKENTKNPDKNPDQCPVETVRPDLGGFYVQLSFTLQITFRSSSLNHIVLFADSSDLFEAVTQHCLRVASAGLTKDRDGKFVCFYIPFVQPAFPLFA